MQILVPTTDSEPDPAHVAYVVRIAASLGAGLLVLHVRQSSDPEGDWMATAAAFEEAACDSEVTVDALQKMLVKEHDRAQEIAQAVAGAAAQGHCALIVMGASPQAKLSDWVSGQVREASDVPVVVMPQLPEHSL